MIQFKKSTKIYVGNSFNQIYDPKIFEKKSNDFDNVHGELEIQVLKWIKNKTKHEMIVHSTKFGKFFKSAKSKTYGHLFF